MILRALAVAGLLGSLLAGAPASAAPDHGAQVARAAVPAPRWAPCPQDQALHRVLDRARRARATTCASVRVPLDYDEPRGAQVRLRLVRSAATDPARRIGTLFVNPGGPGAPAADFASYAARALGPRVAARFDVVGIDPRGTGGSGRTTCRGELSRARPRVAFPLTRAQADVQLRFDDQVRRACRQDPTALLDHASTADVARDMELVRRALGDRQLSYYGVSYGSYLGATYAAMFPDRVRALVVDGVLDPVAWSTGVTGRPVTDPFTTRIGSDAGTQEALTAAFAACADAGSGRCAIASAPQATWERVLAAATEGHLVVEGARISAQDLIGFAASSLYESRAIPSFFRFLARLDRLTAAPGTARPDARLARRTAAQQRRLVGLRDRRAAAGPWTPLPARTRTLDLQAPAVMCSDSRNPDGPRAWIRSAARADRSAPGFGSYWTWISSVCASGGVGSGADSFRGPWRTRTSTPLLVVGNSHDPATPITGARRVHELFAGSRLLTYDGWGHAALGTGRCVTRTVADYLVERRLPARDRTCRAPALFPARRG